ncbi:hypothetical protein [Streptomyces uncialis]|uniref:hypothetical protein n=1 Tax=Streptomyces uncialis TaxID=1048205 RepID=UPI0033F110C5
MATIRAIRVVRGRPFAGHRPPRRRGRPGRAEQDRAISHSLGAGSGSGGGVPYALRAVAGQLADDPDVGRPSGPPGVLTVTVDGDMFEDCPEPAIRCIREPDRVEIRFLTATARGASTDNHGSNPEQGRQPDERAVTAGTAVTVRGVADAWHRIARRLQRHAPGSYAAIRAGAGPAAIAALEDGLDIRIPVELHTLWLLTAGDDGADGWGCLPGNCALMNLNAVVATYRLKMSSQAEQDRLDTDRPDEERITVWRPSWIPVVGFSPTNSTSGLYLDSTTGYLGRWSRYDEAIDDGPDTLVTYLEEAADMLDTPALATRDRPGLIGTTLGWLSSVDPAWEGRWQPLTG